jgi:hypothetical protein
MNAAAGELRAGAAAERRPRAESAPEIGQVGCVQLDGGAVAGVGTHDQLPEPTRATAARPRSSRAAAAERAAQRHEALGASGARAAALMWSAAA